jgi:hypothetical protein
MNDRELLEMAAKAARLEISRCRLDDKMWKDMLLAEKHQDFEGIGKGWNPLTDDGDALRLAIALEMTIEVSISPSGKCHAWACAAGIKDMGQSIVNDDRGMAVREAIVRAAYDVGREMI